MQSQTIILLHGLGRNGDDFKKLKSFLQELGYKIYAPSYPTSAIRIKEIVSDYLEPLINSIEEKELIFITHSMGSLMLRYWYKFKNKEKSVKKAIFLSPPSKGSPVADFFKIVLPYPINYPVAELGTSYNSFVYTLGFCGFLHGIITGANNKRIVFFNSHIPGDDNDGLIRPKDSLTPDYNDFLLLPHLDHDNILYNTEVFEYIKNYLQNDKFKSDKENIKLG